MSTVPVVEVFGPVVQGEGPLAGFATSFLRVAGCDYRCSWCDTPYAVLPEQWARTAERLTHEEMAERVLAIEAPWVTISGGNPAMYDLLPLVHLLQPVRAVAVETQGSFFKPWLGRVDQLVVSPKPPSSGWSDHAERDLPLFLDQLEEFSTDLPLRVALKIVIANRADYDWARDLARNCWWEGEPIYLSVCTPPSSGDPRLVVCEAYSELIGWVTDDVAHGGWDRDVSVLPQLHVLAFGHARGV